MFIGADLGGRHARAALVGDGNFRIYERSHTGGRDALAALDRVISDARGERNLFGVGIAVPGLYDDTVLVKSGNLRALEGTNLDRYNLPVRLLHDITAFRAGEAKALGFERVVAQNFGSGWSACFGTCAGKEQHDCTTRVYDGWRSWSDVQRSVGAQDVLDRYRARGGREETLDAVWSEQSELAQTTRREVESTAIALLERVDALHPADMHIYSGGQARRIVPALRAAFPNLRIAMSDDYVRSAIIGAAETAKYAMHFPAEAAYRLRQSK